MEWASSNLSDSTYGFATFAGCGRTFLCSTEIDENAMKIKHTQRDLRAQSSGAETFGHEIIAKCAYYLWQARGCPSGNAEEIWFEAQKLLRTNGAEVSETEPNRTPATNRAWARSRTADTENLATNQAGTGLIHKTTLR